LLTKHRNFEHDDASSAYGTGKFKLLSGM